VLRRDRIEAQHYRVPTFVPVLGAASSAGLVMFTIANDPLAALRACVLVGLGAVLWFINRAFHERAKSIDVERLDI
jgi:APA family basic amino acid/polyamine antiporter